MEKNNKFLGTEKIEKLLRMFAIPCVMSLIIQSLYNIVDQIFIGNCASLGQFGNTATGIIYPLTVIALAIGLWLGDGAAASISLNQGRNDTKSTHKAIGTSLTISAIISIILVIVFMAFKSNIIYGLGASEAVFSYASEYANFIILGFPFFIIGTVMNPIIRSDGSPKYAMMTMIIGAITNIILDPIFLFGFNMGMNGAALATFLGQVLTFVLSLIYFLRTKTFKLVLNSFRPQVKLLTTTLKLGISSFLTQISIVIVSIVNNRVLLYYLPNDVSAIGLLNIAYKVFGIVISIVIGISCGGQPIIGYNYGAKKYSRVKETYKYIIIADIIVGLIATILFETVPDLIFKMFGYGKVSEFGINTFRIYLSMIMFTCLTKSTSVFFQSVGEPVKSAILSTLRDLVLLVLLSIFLPMFFGIDMYLWSAPISDTITLLVMIILIISFMKKLKVTDNEKALPSAIKRSHKGKIIVISREHGAGGREIALALAKQLNIPFYDKEIVSMVSEESGISTDYIDNMENKSLYSTLDVTPDVIKAQSELLNKIALNGSCVILGRSADYVLKDYDLCKVFLYAPMAYKIKRIRHNYGDNKKIAEENIIKSDKRRSKYYHDFTGLTWGYYKNYNLTLDSSIGVSSSINVILKYLDK